VTHNARIAMAMLGMLAASLPGPIPSWDDGCKDPPGAKPVTPRDPVGRNDPCPCGSGRKYKKCCMTKGERK
jgi:preprotein translocase subunit SecA